MTNNSDDVFRKVLYIVLLIIAIVVPSTILTIFYIGDFIRDDITRVENAMKSEFTDIENAMKSKFTSNEIRMSYLQSSFDNFSEDLDDTQTALAAKLDNQFRNYRLVVRKLTQGDHEAAKDLFDDLLAGWPLDIISTKLASPPTIVSLSLDGKHEINLITHMSNTTNYKLPDAQYPDFSPDGSKIVFTSHFSTFKEDSNLSDSEVFIYDLFSEELIQVTTNTIDDFQPRWSSSETENRLIFHSFRETIEYEEGKLRPLFDLKTVDLNSDIYETTIILTSDNHESYILPSWSPDASQITYTRITADNKWDIFIMNSDGTGQKRITETSTTNCQSNWHPNGRYIAYTYAPQGDHANEIYVVDLLTGKSQPLIKGHLSVFCPTWCLDGKSILYSSNSLPTAIDDDGSIVLLDEHERPLKNARVPTYLHDAKVQINDNVLKVIDDSIISKNLPKEAYNYARWNPFPFKLQALDSL